MTDEEKESAREDAYVVTENLHGRTVLILDDLYESGATMAGVANAARRAGASTVLGLASTRVRRQR